MKSSMTCILFVKYNYNGQVEGNEISKEYSLNEEKSNAYRILVGTPGPGS
jgi:hypothetical protein